MCDFQFCKPKETIEFHQTDLRKAAFLNAPIDKFRFISCLWPLSHGRKTIYDARRVDGKGYFDLTNIEDPEPLTERGPHDPGILEDIFQQLKKNAKADHNEMLVSDWHYGEKEMQRLRLKQEVAEFSLSEGRWWRSFFLFMVLWFYKWFSGYGEEPLRGFLWMIVFIILPILTKIPTPSFFKDLSFLTSWQLFPGDALNYIPLSKQKIDPASYGLLPRLQMIIWQIAISAQAALFGFALRNRLRR